MKHHSSPIFSLKKKKKKNYCYGRPPLIHGDPINSSTGSLHNFPIENDNNNRPMNNDNNNRFMNDNNNRLINNNNRLINNNDDRFIHNNNNDNVVGDNWAENKGFVVNYGNTKGLPSLNNKIAPSN